MKWLWRKQTDRLAEAKREQQEIKKHGQEREPMIRRAEKRLQQNGFGDLFKRALGG
jgi:hypothetical protein